MTMQKLQSIDDIKTKVVSESEAPGRRISFHERQQGDSPDELKTQYAEAKINRKCVRNYE